VIFVCAICAAIARNEFIVQPNALDPLPARYNHHARPVPLAALIFAVEFDIRPAVFCPLQNTFAGCEAART
jgi:hypothetical protein